MKILINLVVAMMISQSALSQNASINSAISIVELPQIDFNQSVGAALHSNPDATVNTQPSETWLRSISQLILDAPIEYPARGRAYQIEGKMYVKIGLKSDGKLQVIAFGKSLGTDFEQAIIEGINKLPLSKIKPLALPLTQQVYIVIPIYFK